MEKEQLNKSALGALRQMATERTAAFCPVTEATLAAMTLAQLSGMFGDAKLSTHPDAQALQSLILVHVQGRLEVTCGVKLP